MSRRAEPIWGMVVSVDVHADLPRPAAGAAIDEVFRWFEHVDSVFSPYRADSDVSRLAAGAIGLGDADPDLASVLARCETLRHETAGYFDARRPDGSVDPTGLVKGWAVERASSMLVARGAANHMINAGGDVRTRGGPHPRPHWQVGIAHPLERDALTSLVAVTDAAIATSGIAERGAHVYDPHTGRAALDLASVTLLATGPEADLGTLDAYATAALAMGFDAPAWIEHLEHVEGCIVDAGGMMWTTPGFGHGRSGTSLDDAASGVR